MDPTASNQNPSQPFNNGAPLTPAQVQAAQQQLGFSNTPGTPTSPTNQTPAQRLASLGLNPDGSPVSTASTQTSPQNNLGDILNRANANATAGKGIWNALTSSEQTLGGGLTTVLPGPTGLGAQDTANKINQSHYDAEDALLSAVKAETDPAKKQALLDFYQKQYPGGYQPVTEADINPNFKLTPGQIVGAGAGTALDVLSAGTYGAEGAKTGELLTKGAPVATEAINQSLGQTLKDIGTKTAIRTGIGAATGYGYDVSRNLQEGKTGAEAATPGMGALLGGLVPLGVGGIEAGTAITKSIAPNIINSLIKPLAKDFAYGKNPGKTISELGITGNNMEDFANNVVDARKDIGSQLGQLTSGLEGKATLDLSNATNPIDSAIEQASKTPQTNSALITRLEAIKSDLTDYIGGDGKNLTFAEGIDAKGVVGDLTKWTGSPSDDKIVNKALQQVYGTINGEIMNKAEQADPEIAAKMSDLNGKYGDLLSAESAINHTAAIGQRTNLISSPIKLGTAAGVITAIGTGGAAIPSILAGASAAALDKALGSTAVKTRIAAWLGDEAPGVISKVLEQNPGIKEVLYRALPKFAAQLGQSTTP